MKALLGSTYDVFGFLSTNPLFPYALPLIFLEDIGIFAVMVIVCTNSNSSDDKKPVLLGRLKGNQLRKLAGLLDMLYTPAELAVAIGFTRRQVYRAYLPLDCPHERDDVGHIFINGHAFREWYRKTYKKLKLSDDEVYCVSCKNIVHLENPVKMQRGNYQYWSMACPNCGRKIAKAITNRRISDQQN